ncbi:MAG TPA: choice-of-anchor Q domain-containing protein [Acidimicrobiales bacterium]|nr:choice-of-anchor Q domain-containing protein [Acidimicrobiales bacterium]
MSELSRSAHGLAVTARGAGSWVAAAVPVLVVVASALGLIGTASPAGATGRVRLYAYAPGGASPPSSCPETTTFSERCTLTQALAQAGPGDVVALATPGRTGFYLGNWSIDQSGTTSSAPLTIEPAPGVTNPTLDGNDGKAAGCSTETCAGPVLTVGRGVHVDLDSLTIRDADDTTGSRGGAIDNVGGDLAVSSSVFLDNTAKGQPGSAADGGAIDNGDGGGSGTVTVSASTFSGNSASGDGGAIDNGNDGGSGTVTVSASTFSGNSASEDGGAIDNGDNGAGSRVSTGTLTVSASTFSANVAGSDASTADDGGAIDNGDNGGSGTVTVSASTFSGNSASGDGGAIDNGNDEGTGDLWAAADIFGGSSSYDACANLGTNLGAWHDEGFNVAADDGCLNGGPRDQHQTDVSRFLGPLAANGGSTETILPLAGNYALGDIPFGAKVELNRATVTLCPARDERGITSPPGQACNSGAVQLQILPPPSHPVTLFAYASAAPGSRNGCPNTTATASRCDLSEALELAASGDTVALATPGPYRGNWTIVTPRTNPDVPVVIEPARGVSNPVLTGSGAAVLGVGPNSYVDLKGVTIKAADNTTDGDGGAVNNAGYLSVSGCSFTKDQAAKSNLNLEADITSVYGAGGAIYNTGTLTVSGSSFSSDAAAIGDHITGDYILFSGNGGAIYNSGTLVLVTSTLSGDNASYGGAIFNIGTLSVSRSTFTANSTQGDGGAIDNADNGPGVAHVSSSTFANNTATESVEQTDGGPLDTGPGDGGAIYNGSAGTLSATTSTFSGDSAAQGGGGAIYTGGDSTVAASTFTGDTAKLSGGAIGLIGKGTLRVSVSTFSADGAKFDPGALGANGASHLSLWSSTFSTARPVYAAPGATAWVAANIFAGVCTLQGAKWTDQGFEVGNNDSCLNGGRGDARQGASRLGPLVGNGGPTRTMKPLTTSPAIEAVPYGTAVKLDGVRVTLCPATDQRGVPSLPGKACEAGAVQLVGAVLRTGR